MYMYTILSYTCIYTLYTTKTSIIYIRMYSIYKNNRQYRYSIDTK